eukprot:TRINITY_DN5932_c0_g7_i1.p1 TRINITY_DN5932_c0_g7~~TRINITY_DN5932_c0_g7_i1.p1  ORF type:complete len:791 (-),score=158.97 TRINITY_DN5932_c0_g7_i1:380-2545(-)
MATSAARAAEARVQPTQQRQQKGVVKGPSIGTQTSVEATRILQLSPPLPADILSRDTVKGGSGRGSSSRVADPRSSSPNAIKEKTKAESRVFDVKATGGQRVIAIGQTRVLPVQSSVSPLMSSPLSLASSTARQLTPVGGAAATVGTKGEIGAVADGTKGVRPGRQERLGEQSAAFGKTSAGSPVVEPGSVLPVTVAGVQRPTRASARTRGTSPSLKPSDLKTSVIGKSGTSDLRREGGEGAAVGVSVEKGKERVGQSGRGREGAGSSPGGTLVARSEAGSSEREGALSTDAKKGVAVNMARARGEPDVAKGTIRMDAKQRATVDLARDIVKESKPARGRERKAIEGVDEKGRVSKEKAAGRGAERVVGGGARAGKAAETREMPVVEASKDLVKEDKGRGRARGRGTDEKEKDRAERTGRNAVKENPADSTRSSRDEKAKVVNDMSGRTHGDTRLEGGAVAESVAAFGKPQGQQKEDPMMASKSLDPLLSAVDLTQGRTTKKDEVVVSDSAEKGKASGSAANSPSGAGEVSVEHNIIDANSAPITISSRGTSTQSSDNGNAGGSTRQGQSNKSSNAKGTQDPTASSAGHVASGGEDDSSNSKSKGSRVNSQAVGQKTLGLEASPKAEPETKVSQTKTGDRGAASQSRIDAVAARVRVKGAPKGGGKRRREKSGKGGEQAKTASVSTVDESHGKASEVAGGGKGAEAAASRRDKRMRAKRRR